MILQKKLQGELAHAWLTLGLASHLANERAANVACWAFEYVEDNGRTDYASLMSNLREAMEILRRDDYAARNPKLPPSDYEIGLYVGAGIATVHAVFWSQFIP